MFAQIKFVREQYNIHIIDYTSTIDTIEIKHEAHNRQGFALGSVLAAEFTASNKGMLSMDDMLKL